MRKLHLVAAAAILAATVPAAAQDQTRYYGVSNIDTRLQRLEERVDRQVQNGRIGRSEAALIDRDIRGVRDLQRRYSRNGLTQWELADLQRRIDTIQARFRDARGDYRDRRYDGDDYYGDRGEQWDDRYDRRDNRYDRYDRWEDRDDRWEERDDRWQDRDDRYRHDAPGGYYAVPERYRYQYRDTDRHYFRYRDGYIYQFDRQTGRTVNSFWIGRQ